jgi:hypothetical protein
MIHAFTIEVSGVDTAREDYEDAFYGAGCDDALIAVVGGAVYLDFDREAPSFGEAVQSASRDVERAGAKVVRVMPIPG